ncbi:hypothetical protein HZA86_01835 [Candidatus Uhrbacteria bacterium]|nr:hypothetical protein [Candidatus Uhrbacteria bacterium]
MRIIVGVIIAAIGILLTLKSEWLYQNMGGIEVAERWLGSSGGSRLFYKLTGICITFIGFLMVTNLLGNIILWIFAPLFRGFSPNA